MYRDEVPEEIVNTELELLRSRDILAKVVDELHLERAYLNRGTEPSLASELAVRDLGRALSAATIRKTNLIQVTYGNTNPQLASTVLARLSDAYLESHLVMHSSPGSYQLFKQQGEEAERQLQQAQQELAALARSENLLIPEEQKREVMASLTAAETEYAELKAQIQDAVARVKTSVQKLTEVPRRVQAEVRSVPNQESVDRLTVMIVELKNKRTELSTKFTADDRRIAELNRQIADTTAALTEARTLSAEQQSTNINPAWTELDAESMRAQLTLSGLVGKEQELARRLSEYRSRLQVLAEATPHVRSGRATRRARAGELPALHQEGRRSANRGGAESPADLERRPRAGAARVVGPGEAGSESRSRHRVLDRVRAGGPRRGARRARGDGAVVRQQAPARARQRRRFVAGCRAVLTLEECSMKSIGSAIVCLIALLAVTSPASGQIPFPEVSTASYHIEVADVLVVKFRYTPEYDSTPTVQPDGYISLPMVGQVKVGGLTVSDAVSANRGGGEQASERP
ncbi:MAG: polysaccharide biosynthesis/export family protein [Vicinamibacterales bacterium]